MIRTKPKTGHFTCYENQTFSLATDRRNFLRLSAGLAGSTLLGRTIANGYGEETESLIAVPAPQQREIPESIRKLKRMTEGIVPITLDERKGRIEKARRLMRENKI